MHCNIFVLVVVLEWKGSRLDVVLGYSTAAVLMKLFLTDTQ